MNSTMTYEKLYTNMVRKFTIEKNGTEYKLGEYMLTRAKAKREAAMVAVSETSNLPVQRTQGNAGTAIAAIFSYVNDKLTLKQPPAHDKTMRTFPLRTSITALCSALVVCSLVVCCGIFGFKSALPENDNMVTVEENYEDAVEMTEEIGYSIENQK